MKKTFKSWVVVNSKGEVYKNHIATSRMKAICYRCNRTLNYKNKESIMGDWKYLHYKKDYCVIRAEITVNINQKRK